ncbi:hypothetical protein quinque_013592 [Culex quinquefasciatus]
MNLSHEQHLIGQVLYFAIRAHALGVSGAAVSNYEDDQKRPIKPFTTETKTSLGHSVFVTPGNVTSSSSNATSSTSASPDYVQQTNVTTNIPTIYNSRTLPLEQKLIDELKQQQQIADTQSYILQNANETVNYNNTLSRGYNPTPTINHDNRTLSPFESWSASQLLQEHEQHQRRRSPSLIDNYMDNDVQQFYASQHDQMSLLNNNPPVPPPPIYSTANPPYFYEPQQSHQLAQHPHPHQLQQHQQQHQQLPPQQYSHDALNPMTTPLHVTIT